LIRCVQTGRSDIPLTPHGEEQVEAKAHLLVGEGSESYQSHADPKNSILNPCPDLIDPSNLCTVFVSPRIRAQKTFQLLFKHLPELPHHTLTEECREWDYGDYEGLKPAEIQELTPGWSIWRDGCRGGESVEEMQTRVDGVIAKVHDWHRRYKEGDDTVTRDVMIIAHGHFSRVLISRWIQFPLHLGMFYEFEPISLEILMGICRNTFHG